MISKVRQPFLCSIQISRYISRSPVYPSAVNSYSPSHGGQRTPNEHHYYKTTIPINEQKQQQQQCKCNGNGTIQTPATADGKATTTAAAAGAPMRNACHDIHDVTTNAIPSGVPSIVPSLATATPPVCSCMGMRNGQTNENHTTATTTTTTTTIEYELTNGIAKLSKISTSRVAAEQPSNANAASVNVLKSESQTRLNCETVATQSETTNSKVPLLSQADLDDLMRNVSAINAVNRTLRHTYSNQQGHLYNHQQQQQTPLYNLQQRSNIHMDFSSMNGSSNGSPLKKVPRDRLGLWGAGGDNDVPGNVSGLQRLQQKKYNKGLAFSLEERQLLGIQGLLPARVKTEEEQVEHCLLLLDRLENDLDKYMYLNTLAERNERLFYKVLSSDVSKMMPLVYTPTVGLACQKFSLIFQYPKGMYININDKGHVYEVLRNWPETDVRAIVVTDGERILGLGDLGANGMGIPVGKLSLYTALAGIKPSQCLPITLDVGTNTESILNDPLYIGLRQKRVTGPEYDEFIDEFMHAAVRRFGQNCLIQFEDFANANAFRLLKKYRDDFCTFNDDIQGTASVAVAGLLASLKIKNTQLKENKILFFGAGEAALGIANLCLMALMKEGLSEAEAKERIWMVDSKGLIVKNRPTGGITEHKLHFAQDHAPIDTLAEAVETLQPSVLIGAAAIGGAFTKDILEKMAEYNDIPIIFALSNPTSKAECTAEEAYKYTNGKCIFASGSPFDPVEYNGKTFYPGQGNNSYIFPGVALGVLCAGMLTIPEEVFLMSAERLADLCEPEDLERGSLYPPLKKITECSVEIAAYIMEYAYKNGLATVRPEPEDKREFIKSQMYDLHYSSAIPEVYSWNQKL
ncbi:NADP-dependent malic enzyme-like isoform X1 [Musca vetustissima]|uniref:NADP-dependent malic enzyme-like isoform X1 n=1 Tax=Musca vetustissima TaxID=27455 RepID=UPI002AB6CDBA|nr:NADP-dependent malic enzyme-like isoform X1 [Musca vetustissima]